MKRELAERIILEYVKPVYGFALRRCRCREDAEDLSQEIITRAFISLCKRDDLDNTAAFIWRVAHNALANYYRDNAKFSLGLPLEEIADGLCDPDSELISNDSAETLDMLRCKIAYLSRIQRRVVIAYYFEGKRQAEIARTLGIAEGTVKWHLFEAKKELRKGMENMKNTSNLKFDPIEFHTIGLCGSIGEGRAHEMLKPVLVQNICYAVRESAKTVNEIADDLGVSPVYVEGEIEKLEEYGLLSAAKRGYLANFIIDEPTAEELIFHDRMYKRAAELYAPALCDSIVASGLLRDPELHSQEDDNYILLALILYIAARADEKCFEEKITFDEVATHRPDGGQNIFHASVVDESIKLPEDYIYMKDWCGPMWIEYAGHTKWQIDTEWSGRFGRPGNLHVEEAKRMLNLYDREAREPLSSDECAYLCECGYARMEDGRLVWMPVIIGSRELESKLLALGAELSYRLKAEFDAMKEEHSALVLASIPAQMRRMREYELQFTFRSDGWFLLHCLRNLLDSGRLKAPSDEQKRGALTVIV